MKKRILPIILVFGMIIATFPIVTFASNIVEVTTFDALKTALTATVTGETADNPTIVVLKNSVVATSEIGINGTPKFKTLVTDGNYTISREQGVEGGATGHLGFMFQIRGGSVLNLGGVSGYNGVITVDAANPFGKYPWTQPGVCDATIFIAEGSYFNMYSGNLINGKFSSGNGAIKIEASTVNLYGGTISNNTVYDTSWQVGGGVYMNSNSNLLIDGVEITENSAAGGSAIACDNSHITFNSGLIGGNIGGNAIQANGDQTNPSTIAMGGSAKFASTDSISMSNSTTVNITSNLTTQGAVATFTNVSNGRQVLSGTLMEANAGKFRAFLGGTTYCGVNELGQVDNTKTAPEFYSGDVAVTGVGVTPTTATVGIDRTQQLTATVAPSNATNKTVSWNSSNINIATVSSSGLVTGVSEGNATITVTTQDGGKTATCAVTVTENPPLVGVEVTTFGALKAALTTVVSGETAENPTVIILKNNIIATSEIGMTDTPKYKTLVADGNYTISREQGVVDGATGNLGFIFQVRSGVLNLGGISGSGVITIDGANPYGKYPWSEAGIVSPIIFVADGATFNMYSGNLINNKTNGGDGAIKIEASTVNLYGGTLTNNTVRDPSYQVGGAIYMKSNSHLLIDGVEITGNSAGGGSAIMCDNSHITINSGKIEGNIGSNAIQLNGDQTNPSTISMGGSAKLASTDSILLNNSTTVNITSNLTTQGAVATFINVSNGQQVLSGDSALIAANAGHFVAITPNKTCGVGTDGMVNESLEAPTFGGTPPTPEITLGYTGTAATVNANFEINNAELIVASYDDDGNLVDVDNFHDVDVTANVPLSETLKTGFSAGDKVKVMLWDSLDTIKPLTDVFVQ